MTDHDPHEATDPMASELSGAGRRLHQQAPDEIAARQALARVQERAEATPASHRSWWPALIGAGLAAAAVVGVIAIRADDTTTIAPVQTNPDTEPAPTLVTDTTDPTDAANATSTTSAPDNGASVSIDSGCITVTTAAGSATGCPQNDGQLDHLEGRRFVADLDGPVVVTSGTSDPLAGLTATIDDSEFVAACRWDEFAPRVPAGGLVEVVTCNDTGVMGLTTTPDQVADFGPSYFTLPTPYFPDGAELGLGTPVEGLPRALAFTAPMPDIVTCSILLPPDRSGWKEACGLDQGTAVRTALVELDEPSPADSGVWQISVDDTGLIAAATALDTAAPSSGCSIDSTTDLLRLLPDSSVITGIGCIDGRASIDSGSVLTQDGPPDGSIWLAERDANGPWVVTDTGTGLDDTFSFPIVPIAQWPESTRARPSSYWSDPIVTIPAQPDVDTLASEVLATISTLNTDPEFALNERLVAVRPDGLPLIIVQVDLGGDDSVIGGVIYVWLDETFDDNGPTGWQAGDVLVGNVCGRGGSAGQDLCI